ncbi:MAG: sodium-dependent transporter [Lachnospiraceae bacterium]|nr:sodium-dependent transporter [Lachnospiraceae bacterium]MDD5852793.1 sodium-dependent transporter [Lachnospiraceae bacterium]
MEKKTQRHAFSGSLGFVLAAAGSAVGLGNIWRFPYLAAKDGGGLFLVVYIVLALTFGFSLLTTDIAIGRNTKQGPLTAYRVVDKRFGFLGILGCLIPAIIMPYYCAIGGWVIKYFVAFLTGDGMNAAQDGYFTGFITSDVSPIVYMVIFLGVVSGVIILGVNKGIESFSKIIMPILIILVLGIAIFSLTISYTGDDGVVRTGMQGLKIYLVPDLEGLTFGKFFSVLVDAMGQLFFSLSVAMGIMIAYGSYVKDDANLVKSINQIEIFDTGVAILAGVMIIPAVFTFMGREGMEASGPSLMFVSLPKVFAQMGVVGNVIGCMFFAMVLFAAITSAISIEEAVVSSFMDKFHLKRVQATILETVIALVFGVIVCLGYNKLYFEVKLPNGTVAQVLDVMDYISNNVLMPLISIGTCILIGWVKKPQFIIDEAEKNGEKFGRAKLYAVMMKYIAPVMLFILFLKSIGILNIFD